MSRYAPKTANKTVLCSLRCRCQNIYIGCAALQQDRPPSPAATYRRASHRSCPRTIVIRTLAAPPPFAWFSVYHVGCAADAAPRENDKSKKGTPPTKTTESCGSPRVKSLLTTVGRKAYE